jgi:hypothetical protein
MFGQSHTEQRLVAVGAVGVDERTGQFGRGLGESAVGRSTCAIQPKLAGWLARLTWGL